MSDGRRKQLVFQKKKESVVIYLDYKLFVIFEPFSSIRERCGEVARWVFLAWRNCSVLLQKNTTCVDDINYYHRVTLWLLIITEPPFLKKPRCFHASSEILFRASINQLINHLNKSYKYTHYPWATTFEVFFVYWKCHKNNSNSKKK